MKVKTDVLMEDRAADMSPQVLTIQPNTVIIEKRN